MTVSAHAAEEGRVEATPAGVSPCANAKELVATDCSLTWYGITLYGAYDIGVGWVSHGLPENGYNYEGESLVNRNAASSRFLPTTATATWLRRWVRASPSDRARH